MLPRGIGRQAAANPQRGWTALVIAEPQRAFSGGQFQLVFPQLTHYGIDLWVPELGGRVDPDSEGHEMLMSLFGGLSKAERRRLQTRTRNAMLAHGAAGRWLGGRPNYGYRLVDTDVPHPQRQKAAAGINCARWCPTRRRRPSCSASSRCSTRASATGRSPPSSSATDSPPPARSARPSTPARPAYRAAPRCGRSQPPLPGPPGHRPPAPQRRADRPHRPHQPPTLATHRPVGHLRRASVASPRRRSALDSGHRPDHEHPRTAAASTEGRAGQVPAARRDAALLGLWPVDARRHAQGQALLPVQLSAPRLRRGRRAPEDHGGPGRADPRRSRPLARPAHRPRPSDRNPRCRPGHRH